MLTGHLPNNFFFADCNILHISFVILEILLRFNSTGFGRIIDHPMLYSQSNNIGPFHKVIISPFIEATFLQADHEGVVINDSIVDLNSIHTETNNGVLRLYLDGAKDIPQKSYDSQGKDPRLYPDRAVGATIYFKKLTALSLRGKERFRCSGLLSANQFTVRLYGESAIRFEEVHIKSLKAAIYGESSLVIESGSVEHQVYTCYGKGRVNATAISGAEAKLIAYGGANFNMNVSERIKITSFGDAKLWYKGNPQIVKGINVGGVDVARVD